MFSHVALIMFVRGNENQILMRRFLHIIIIMAVLLFASSLPGLVLAGDGACYSDWSVAAPIVKKEGLVSVEQLTPMARAQLNGELVKVTLCVQAGSYVFRLVVRGTKGDLKTVTVDAKSPF